MDVEVVIWEHLLYLFIFNRFGYGKERFIIFKYLLYYRRWNFFGGDCHYFWDWKRSCVTRILLKNIDNNNLKITRTNWKKKMQVVLEHWRLCTQILYILVYVQAASRPLTLPRATYSVTLSLPRLSVNNTATTGRCYAVHGWRMPKINTENTYFYAIVCEHRNMWRKW